MLVDLQEDHGILSYNSDGMLRESSLVSSTASSQVPGCKAMLLTAPGTASVVQAPPKLAP